MMSGTHQQRLEGLLSAAAGTISRPMFPQQRWEMLRRLTFEYGLGSEEFIQAGRAGGYFPTHAQRLDMLTHEQLLSEYWGMGYRQAADDLGRIVPIQELSESELYDRLLHLCQPRTTSHLQQAA